MICPHGMPTPASCLDCMEEGNLPPPPRPERPKVLHTFAARYDGDCPECHLPIRVGQMVSALSSGAYVHESCG